MDTYENNISHNISYNKYKYPWGKQLLNENISEDMNDKIISYLIIIDGISLNQDLMIKDFLTCFYFPHPCQVIFERYIIEEIEYESTFKYRMIENDVQMVFFRMYKFSSA